MQKFSRVLSLLPLVLSASALAAPAKCPELIKVEQGGETTYWTKGVLAGEYDEPLLPYSAYAEGKVSYGAAREMAEQLTEVCAAQLGDMVFQLPTQPQIADFLAKPESAGTYTNFGRNSWVLYHTSGDAKLIYDTTGMPMPLLGIPAVVNMKYEATGKKFQRESYHAYAHFRASLPKAD